MIHNVKNYRIRDLQQTFINTYYDNNAMDPEMFQQGPSESTVLRTLHRDGLTRKIIQHRHYLRNDTAGYDFLKRIQHIDPHDLIDIDETASSPQSFLDKYGWSPRGEECVHVQILINNTAYSTISAVSPFGFISWEIFDTTITQAEFSQFITNNVALNIANDDIVAILDNAAIHRTDMSILALHQVFNENYTFCPQ